MWEITGAEFSKSEAHTADGISIRFPRCTRIRDDKDWKSATNLPQLKVPAACVSSTPTIPALEHWAPGLCGLFLISLMGQKGQLERETKLLRGQSTSTRYQAWLVSLESQRMRVARKHPAEGLAPGYSLYVVKNWEQRTVICTYSLRKHSQSLEKHQGSQLLFPVFLFPLFVPLSHAPKTHLTDHL